MAAEEPGGRETGRAVVLFAREPPGERRADRLDDALGIAALALLVRLAVVAWAASRFPPAADGAYYQRIAERIAQGLGYTWLWPDGAVTYAAHYPVGYPALAGAAYAIFGPRPAVAMVLNAFLGALAAFSAHRLASRAASRRLALAAGLLVALHPGLVAYTPALMTEGVTASLLACAAAVAAWARASGDPTPTPPRGGARNGGEQRAERSQGSLARAAVIGVVVGLAALVRPQSIVLAPILALLAVTKLPWRRRAAMIAAAALAALLVCAPWTARNCVRMKRCALVSVNGGWNLLIGADAGSTGAWSPIKVPAACREVFDEAQKDVCFGEQARAYIAEHPAAWALLVPRKLAATFDYAGAAGWYLHESNPAAFPYEAKKVLGGVETIYERLVLLFALGWAARALPGPEPRARRWARAAVAVVGGGFAFALHAWVAYAAFPVAALLRGRSLWRGPVLPPATVVVVLSTIGVHAVFFGAGRYSMVVFPLLAALAPLALDGKPPKSEKKELRDRRFDDLPGTNLS
jgi:4-amino-4-deoxy-L-arabinose transferase-like glycosyltransferase